MPTDKQIEAGLVHYSEGGCMGLSEHERREVVIAILTAAEQAQEAQPVRAGQHVAYFDDGQFHWMSGIHPRNCELYTSPTIPEGYQLVPIEPTREMREEGLRQTDFYAEAYHAMLAAAPNPEK